MALGNRGGLAMKWEMEAVQLRAIGRLRTPYRDKFGVPRQPGLVPAARGRLVFEEAYRREEAMRGLEQYSHLWIVFLFDRVGEGEERLSVRPPRLGGNEKVGVFATRSPFRPNRLGLSVCKLEGIDRAGEDGPALLLSGVDVVDDTPVVDIKPYLPFADRIEGARACMAPEPPPALEVSVAEGARAAFSRMSGEEQDVMVQTLRWDGRPAFHGEERTYFLRIFDYEVAWTVRAGRCVVTGIGHKER